MNDKRKIIMWDDIPSKFQRKNSVIFELNMLIIEILTDKELSLDEKCILVGKVRESFKFKSLLLEIKKK